MRKALAKLETKLERAEGELREHSNTDMEPEVKIDDDSMVGCFFKRILLLVNYRPEYRNEWGNYNYYTQLQLEPLGRESANEMLSALLGDEMELRPLKRLIAEKTEGNPFFIEEMFQALIEEGALQRNGVLKLTRPLTQVRVPTTVQAVLASRIDRLPSEEKDLLQTLAVLGREFPLGLVQRLVPASANDLERLLSRLQRGEFIYEQAVLPEVEYVFKHALTHEVAYKVATFRAA